MPRENRKPFMMVFIIMLSTVPIFSTDMYLPAIPKMVALFDAPLKLVNLTLIVFLICFAASSLIWGTLSDKYGRKPILIFSTATYAFAGILCALSTSVHQLILLRALQGIGGGSALAIAMALVKDVFVGHEREKLLVYQSSLMAVAPIVAPIAGAQLLVWTSWRGTFVLLSGFGLLLLIGSLFYRETAVKNPGKSVFKTMGNLKRLALTPGFFSPLLLFSISGAPILLFVGGAADIYITRFGLSERRFSLFFGFNALFSVVGPFAYIALSRRYTMPSIIRLSFAAIAGSGALLIVVGGLGPLFFALMCIPWAVASSVVRPPSMNILLEQGKQDAGAASSLMNFCFLAAGSAAMILISLEWNDRVLVLGAVTLLAGLYALIRWPATWKKCRPDPNLGRPAGMGPSPER